MNLAAIRRNGEIISQKDSYTCGHLINLTKVASLRYDVKSLDLVVDSYLYLLLTAIMNNVPAKKDRLELYT